MRENTFVFQIYLIYCVYLKDAFLITFLFKHKISNRTVIINGYTKDCQKFEITFLHQRLVFARKQKAGLFKMMIEFHNPQLVQNWRKKLGVHHPDSGWLTTFVHFIHFFYHSFFICFWYLIMLSSLSCSFVWELERNNVDCINSSVLLTT